MDPTETVEEYYEALRRGEPLSPYFAEREDAVKFGVSERLAGYEAIAEGLRDQTSTTDDWQVESRDLRVAVPESAEGDERASPSAAWFTDDVALSWTDSSGERQSFDTRWSGVLERDGRESRDNGTAGSDWRFAQMHVSAPHEL